LTLGELTPQQIIEKHLDGVKGLYVKEVDPNGLAADIRPPNEITAGEVIVRINRVPVTTLVDFQRVVESLKPGDAIVLNISRFDRLSKRVVQRIVQFTYQ
jgi:S1-C subfamily serine protease